jgi:hypothetical protein
VRADAFTTVLSWLGGADAAEVRGRLAETAAAVEAAKEAASMQRAGRCRPRSSRCIATCSLRCAASRRTGCSAAGWSLRSCAAPADLFGPHVDNRARYLAALDQAHAAVQPPGSGRSELNA